MMSKKALLFLFLYHLLICFISFTYISSTGGDAWLYWAKTFDINDYSWVDFFHLNTDFIVFLNYPFIKLGLPFWFGFLLYSCIGFLGILKWIELAQATIGNPFVYKKINFLWILFLLPNLHFWTATLGKEALLFWALATFFLSFYKKRFNSIRFILAIILITVIRPHIAFMLFLAVTIFFAFSIKIQMKTKVRFGLLFFTINAGLLYLVLQLTRIKRIDFDRITRFNTFSINCFKETGSYVPMLEYDYITKWLALHFRPLFFDVKTEMQFLASLENSCYLLVFLVAMFSLLSNYKYIFLHDWMKVSLWFFVIATVIYAERYANSGIFMRTKIMFQPFVLIVLLFIIEQTLQHKNESKQ
jgi:hypothetical protein